MDLLLPNASDTIAVVMKLPGETCNINCHYCYEKRKPYDSAKFLKPELVRRFLALCNGKPLRVILHGGEPLLIGVEPMRAILGTLRDYQGPIRLAIQTNGLLLSERWLRLFDEQWADIEIGVSLDGDAEGNAHRVDFRDRPTFDRVCNAFSLLAHHGRRCGAIMVVTRQSIGRAETAMDEFASHPAIAAVKLSPCLDYNVVTKAKAPNNRRSIELLNPFGEGLPGWATTPAEYTEFVVKATAVWRTKGYWRQFLLEPVVSIVRGLAGRPVNFTHFGQRKEPFIVTLYPDGMIGSSDELQMPQGRLGHVNDDVPLDEILSYKAVPQLHDRLQRMLAKCSGCTHVDTCNGGSLADRLRLEGSPFEEGYCNAKRGLVDAIARITS